MRRGIDDNSFQIELGILKMESALYWMNTVTPKNNKHNKNSNKEAMANTIR